MTDIYLYALLFATSTLLLTVSDSLCSTLSCTSEWEVESEVECIYNSSSQLYTLSWMAIRNGQLRKVASCRIYSSCSITEPVYHVTMYGTTSKLTIRRVQIGMTEVMVWGMGAEMLSFALPVFARPSKPQCAYPFYLKEWVFYPCGVGRVYPQAVCEFSVNGTGLVADHSRIIYVHKQSKETQMYKTTCGFNFTSSEKFWHHQFRVKVYPNVTGGQNHSVSSEWSAVYQFEPITITNFTINSMPGLQPVFVERGRPATFFCQTKGFPFPKLQLIRQGSKKVLAEVEHNNTVKFQISSVGCADASDFACQANPGQALEVLHMSVSGKPILHQPRNQSLLDFLEGYRENTYMFYVESCPPIQSFKLQRAEANGLDDVDLTDFNILVIHQNAVKLTLPSSIWSEQLEAGKLENFILALDNGVDWLNINFMLNFIPDSTDETYPDTAYPGAGEFDTSDEAKEDESSLSGGTDAGIVIGVLLFVVLAVVTIVIICRKRQKGPRPPSVTLAQTDESQFELYDRRNPRVWHTADGRREPPGPEVHLTAPENQLSPSAPVENVDISEFQNYRPPPSYESLTHDGGVSNTDNETPHQPELSNDNLGSDHPPSYDTVCQAHDPPPPYPGHETLV